MAKMTDYTELISEFWPTVMLAWDEHGDKKPIIECDVDTRKVLAMPAKEYLAGLSERTREAAQRNFEEISANGGMMVFIRDDRNRILQSYVFMPSEEDS